MSDINVVNIGDNLTDRGAELERYRTINLSLQEKIERIEQELGLVYDALDESIDIINRFYEEEGFEDSAEAAKLVDKVNSWRVQVEVPDEDTQALQEEGSKSG